MTPIQSGYQWSKYSSRSCHRNHYHWSSRLLPSRFVEISSLHSLHFLPIQPASPYSAFWVKSCYHVRCARTKDGEVRRGAWMHIGYAWLHLLVQRHREYKESSVVKLRDTRGLGDKVLTDTWKSGIRVPGLLGRQSPYGVRERQRWDWSKPGWHRWHRWHR